mmetsp:Transcript_39082/g.69993  ORF Transcript_39082/g.69993 Transcript_39082/m.69993 type:complete len:245 (+) Transcript_39082:151-885(+)
MGTVVDNNGLDLVSVLEALQLLQVLHQLQRCAGHGGVRLQKLGVVALQAEVQQVRLVLVGLRESRDHAVLVVGDHTAGEIDGVAVLVGNALHTASHGHLIVLQWRACSAVHGVTGCLQRNHHLIDDFWLHQRLIALNVDADVKLTAKALNSLCAPLRAVRNSLIRHHHIRAVLPADARDALIISGYHHLVQLLSLHGLHPGPDDHGLPGDGDQWFSRKARGLVASRDDADHTSPLLSHLRFKLK